MVALLHDFLRALELTEGFEGPSVFSARTSCFSVSNCPPPGVCMVGDRGSVRGDLCGGAVSGLLEEHLFEVCVTELTLVYRD